jgi:hypothetical protein
MCLCYNYLRYISNAEENGGASASSPQSPPSIEYEVGGKGHGELKVPLHERFDLLLEVAAPFASLPLTKDNIKAVKTAFILKNSEQARHSRFSLPSTDEIRRAVGVAKVTRALL